MNGTLSALRRMLPRDDGVIVQVGSALAYSAIPLQAAYCAAKHAIGGFTESLRTELMHDRSRVRVKMVHLPALNTPQFGWNKTRLARHPQPVPPIYQPEVAADAVYFAARHHRREVMVGYRTVNPVYGNRVAPVCWTDNSPGPAMTHSKPTRPYRRIAQTTHGIPCRAMTARTVPSMTAQGVSVSVLGKQASPVCRSWWSRFGSPGLSGGAPRGVTRRAQHQCTATGYWNCIEEREELTQDRWRVTTHGQAWPAWCCCQIGESAFSVYRWVK